MLGASSYAKWLKSTFDGAIDLMPIQEDKNFLRSFHLQHLGQADLPGSDAPVNPPPLPAAKTPKTKSTAKQNREKGYKASRKERGKEGSEDARAEGYS